jgi:hypothetical protein
VRVGLGRCALSSYRDEPYAGVRSRTLLCFAVLCEVRDICRVEGTDRWHVLVGEGDLHMNRASGRVRMMAGGTENNLVCSGCMCVLV